MKIDIYTSSKSGEKFLSVPKGTKVETLQLPDSIDPDLLTLSPFRTRLEIDLNKEHPSLNQENILTQIETNGYAVHGAKGFIKIGVN